MGNTVGVLDAFGHELDFELIQSGKVWEVHASGRLQSGTIVGQCQVEGWPLNVQDAGGADGTGRPWVYGAEGHNLTRRGPAQGRSDERSEKLCLFVRKGLGLVGGTEHQRRGLALPGLDVDALQGTGN